MIKQLLSAVDLSFWAEVSLVLFAIIFVAVAVRTLLTDRAQSERHARLALSDPQPGEHNE